MREEYNFRFTEVFILSPEQQSAIEQGRKDFENGDYIESDEANDQMSKWLET